jgi:hypothetical protein
VAAPPASRTGPLPPLSSRCQSSAAHSHRPGPSPAPCCCVAHAAIRHLADPHTPLPLIPFACATVPPRPAVVPELDRVLIDADVQSPAFHHGRELTLAPIHCLIQLPMSTSVVRTPRSSSLSRRLRTTQQASSAAIAAPRMSPPPPLALPLPATSSSERSAGQGEPVLQRRRSCCS